MRVLVCALHWGLGHATRCMPVVDVLMTRGHEVHLAADGSAYEVFAQTFPQLPLHGLAPLDIRYGKHFWLKLFSQSGSIMKWIFRDKKIMFHLNNLHHFDLIISDSRPGCRLKNIPSVIIIHQPSPILPYTGIQWIARRLMWKLLKSFDTVWIPDLAGPQCLSGMLTEMPAWIIRKYVGFLSRIHGDEVESISSDLQHEILAIVSGPEPLRTEFEKKLVKSLEDEDAIIVAGRPYQAEQKNDRIISYLPISDLARYIAQASYVITRGGYSSLMDLSSFGKRIILVPTPGQPEQAYLAARLVSLHMATIWDQDAEPWSAVALRARHINPFFIQNDPLLLESAILEIENALKKI